MWRRLLRRLTGESQAERQQDGIYVSSMSQAKAIRLVLGALLSLALVAPTGSSAADGAYGVPVGADELEEVLPASGGDEGYVREHTVVRTSDGIELDGWIWRPRNGKPAPTVLLYSPYHGNLDPWGNDDRAGDRAGMNLVPTEELMKEGYAIGFFSIPGTGHSGGCFDFFGAKTGRAGADLVDWIARQSWSNGRVGMTGQSNDATTAWQVAAEAPAALKVIVPMSGGIRLYTQVGTPNGLLGWFTGPNALVNVAVIGATPVWNGAPNGQLGPVLRGATRNRLCADVRRALGAQTLDPARDERDGAFWEERDLTDRLGDIRAAVLATAGFNDATVPGFGFEAVGWPLIRSPKAMILADLGHAIPTEVATGDFVDMRIDWFNAFLKNGHRCGASDAPELCEPRPAELGHIYYQTDAPAAGLDSVLEAQSGQWTETSAWPPPEARDEVAYLAGDKLADRPGSAPSELVPAPRAADNYAVGVDRSPCGAPKGSKLFESAPMAVDTTLAGVPHAELRLESDDEGGQVAVSLFELGENFSCTPAAGSHAAPGNPTDSRLITWGGADLRFYDGGYTATVFPTEELTAVPIAMEAAAARIEAGHRLGLLVSGGEPFYRAGNAYLPRLTLSPESRVVLPIIGASRDRHR